MKNLSINLNPSLMTKGTTMYDIDELRNGLANAQIDIYQLQSRIGSLEEKLDKLMDIMAEYIMDTEEEKNGN